MKKISLVGNVRYLGNVMVVIQGNLLVLLMIFFVNQQYMKTWREYPGGEQSTTVYLKNVSTEKQLAVLMHLLAAADEQQLFLVRRDSSLANEGAFSGFRIGVYGNVEVNDVSLTFKGQQILTAGNLEMLLRSENRKSTLGIDMGSVDSIGSIPYFRFYEQIVVMNLSHLYITSETVNGAYQILGLNTEDQKAEFVEALSQISGLSEKELLTETGGTYQDSNFIRYILVAFLSAQLFLNVMFFLVIAVQSLNKQGKLTLLGWSRAAFSKKIFGSFFSIAMAAIPIISILGLILAGWNSFSLTQLILFSLAGIVNLLMTGIELVIASIVVMMTKSLDAIHGRIPKRPLYVLGILAYLLISVGVMFCGSYVDEPIESILANVKLSRQWQGVSDYNILRSVIVGQDSDTFSGQSKQFDQDLYDWYASIAEEDGVYLIHTQYYGEEVLAIWSDNAVYTNVPAKSFWNFILSPNYLENLGIVVSEENLTAARNGVRLYLLPSTLSDTERSKMIAWIEESDKHGVEPLGIQTQFTMQQEFAFMTYEPQQELFTWGTTSSDAMAEKAPVIYVATPENMRYFETESLRVFGLNGYIKFADAETMSKYTQANLMSQFNLLDNEITFVAVQNYIDGLQENIWLTILWFSLIFVVLIIILIGLLLTLATIFRIVNQEKINVKKFLGFRFSQLYQTPMILLTSLILLELLIMIVLNSKFGLLLMCLVVLLQILIFGKYMVRSELKQLLLAFKGE